MSDEDDYDYSDGGSYGGGSDDQSGGGSDDRPQVEIDMENDYYQADDEKNNQPESALNLFLKVISTEEEYRKDTLPNGQEHIFNSLQNVIILICNLQKPQMLVDQVTKILKYMSTVSRNDATDAINNFIECLVKLEDKQIMKQVLEIILAYLEQNNMETLLNKALFRLAYIYFDIKDQNLVSQTLDKIFTINRKKDGTDDEKKASVLLECYALQIQLYVLKNQPIKKILNRVQFIRSQDQNNITDNKIMGIIQENTGKMYMKQKKYQHANLEFQDAFKAYQEVGNAKAKQVLKYWCFASILSKQEIDPFSEQATQVYAQDQEIQSMQTLIGLYQNQEKSNVRQFKSIIDKKENHIMDDDFLKDYVYEVNKTMYLKTICSLVKGYEKIKLKYISQQILAREQQVELFLMELILSGQLNGSIDSTLGVFENYDTNVNQFQESKLENLKKWSNQISAQQ